MTFLQMFKIEYSIIEVVVRCYDSLLPALLYMVYMQPQPIVQTDTRWR